MQRNHRRNIKVRSRLESRVNVSGGYQEVPWLSLTGLWLRNAGFNVGDIVEITILDHAILVSKK